MCKNDYTREQKENSLRSENNTPIFDPLLHHEVVTTSLIHQQRIEYDHHSRLWRAILRLRFWVVPDVSRTIISKKLATWLSTPVATSVNWAISYTAAALLLLHDSITSNGRDWNINVRSIDTVYTPISDDRVLYVTPVSHPLLYQFSALDGTSPIRIYPSSGFVISP